MRPPLRTVRHPMPDKVGLRVFASGRQGHCRRSRRGKGLNGSALVPARPVITQAAWLGAVTRTLPRL